MAAALLALAMVLGQAVDVHDDDAVTDTSQLSPREYLFETYPGLSRRLDCMIRLESSWDPGAVSVGGRYVGLAQFDYRTWMETPQGQAGDSRWDPYASIDAMVWGSAHLGWSRWPVTSRRC